MQRSITRSGNRPGNHTGSHIGSLLLATVVLIGAAPVALAQAPQPPASAPPAPPPETPPPDGAPEQTPAQTPPAQAPEPTPEPVPPPAPVADRTIAGTVLDQDTGVPLAGATVTLVETGQSAVADDLGAFTFSGLTPGSYTLSVSLGGYIAADVPVDASVAALGPVTLLLASDPSFGEVIIMVGSRTERSVLESPVPVDVIDSAMLRQGGHSETGQALATLAPSYQALHQTVSDGSDHVVPASMRGLGPDQVLVLLNGKRRHSTALLHATDNFGRGATGVDLDAIPLSAIERIEVLRDGAAAQYGSDAIAGVINIVLKDQVSVLDAMATTGITGRGDGLTTRVGANYGVAVGDGGVLSITGELVQRGETNRAEPWQGTFFSGVDDYDQTTDMLEQNGLSREDVRMRVGTSQATVGHLFLNGKLPLDGVDLYTFGGATYREGDSAGFYRRPLDEDRVDFDRYPLGFLPRLHPTIIDWALGFGGRTEIEGWKLDLSANHGGNLFLWEIRDSVNASLGAAAGGTTFDAGGLGFLQTNVNADVVRGLEVAWVEKLSLVAGAELRVENFRQMAGEEASWIDGGLTTPGGTPKVPGSQVFPGYQADISEYRSSVGTYVGLESELTERILVDVAGRFEHYSDFGSTLTGKLAGRFEVNDKLALRAAVSNGFRAPSLHQIWFTAVSTQFEVVNGMQTAKQALLANNGSAIAESFGIPGLEEETSINLSAGVTAQPIPGLSLTADVYRIDLQDRIVYSSRLSSNPDDYAGDDELVAATERVREILQMSAPGVSQVEFFVNAVDTSTMGLDLVAEYKLPVAEGVLGVTGAANFTRSEVVDFHIPDGVGTALEIQGDPDTARRLLFSDQEQNRIEDLLPWQKGTLGLSYGRGPWNAMTRARYYGSSRYVGYAGDGSENESYSPKVLFDLEVGHQFENGLSLAIGAENLLNTFPDETKNPANRYNEQFIYRPDQFGMNGGFYYLRLGFVQ